ncbi:MAG: cyclic nucleotide-binding domain-containing protein [Actinobacteria bacterium]|nr:cyclic nucleotide-binding domain-containing protein [Actinomycetota bacterium]
MSVGVAALLSSIPLFAGIPGRERDHLARVMHPFTAPAGSVLFREGDRGDQMYIIESGCVQAARQTPNESRTLALLGPGSVLGELSLMGSGIRNATATAIEETCGWSLERTAFEVLRADPRRDSLDFIRCIGDVALGRLRDRYAAISNALGGEAEPAVPRPQTLQESPPEPGDSGYLKETLFFSRLADPEIATIVGGLRRLHAPRGVVICSSGEVPGALYIVIRGAIETTIRRGRQARRLRLAGPGRAVTHLGVLGPEPSIAECLARERADLLEIPWDRVHALLAGGDAASRGFTAAFNEDVVRALVQADRRTPRMVSRIDRTESVGSIAAISVGRPLATTSPRL